MFRALACCICLLLTAGAAVADEPATPKEAKALTTRQGDKKVPTPEGVKEASTPRAGKKPATPKGDKELSGMSIVGNDDAPKALVIVPWKSSALGDRLAVSRILDDGRQPVDKEVFMRRLDYYDIWAQSQGPPGPDTN